jgi:hypothetical protein
MTRGRPSLPSAVMPGLARQGRVDLFWIPLGAGEPSGCVRWSGRLFEAVAARRGRRPARFLYHSALEVHLDGARFTIEMTPAWGGPAERDVVGGGPVGLRFLAHSRFFRYEVRRWRDGSIPDVSHAVGGPRRMTDDRLLARQVLDLVPDFPTATWGRDEFGAGDMWNSNSLTAWLLTIAGIPTDTSRVNPPREGRAPGWAAGVVVARRQAEAAGRAVTRPPGLRPRA